MDALSWRVQHNCVWCLCQFIQHRQHISCQKCTVIQLIFFCIFCRCINCLFHDFNSCHLFCHRCQYLRNRSGSAIKVIYLFPGQITHIFSCQRIQFLCSGRICLKKGKRRNAKTQPQKFIIKIIFSI